MTHLEAKAMKAAEKLFNAGIPYWNSLECYANGWKAGYLAAQRMARSKSSEGGVKP